MFSIAFLAGGMQMSFPTESTMKLDLGGVGTVDLGKYGFAELRYQHASNSFSNFAIASETGYHTVTASAAGGIPFWFLYGYGLAGLSWELARFTHTLGGSYAQGTSSTYGNHLGTLLGLGLRVRVPSYVPVEARIEADWKRRGQFNDFAFVVTLGAAFGWQEE